MADPFDLAAHERHPLAPASPGPAPWLAQLNEAQRQAVETVEGPVLVLAGAGTGKTRVLTTRLVHILHQGLAWPSQILAVTFTNKAAREMRQRVAALIGTEAAERLWLGTFHAIGARILRRHAELVGLKPNFTILDTDDQLRLLKQLLGAERIDEKRWPPRALAAVIDRWKDKGLGPDQVSPSDGAFADGRGIALYRLYQERLRLLNACDFGDLLGHDLSIFQRHADVLADYQQRFRYILVDEYQDSNVAQYLWLRLLAQRHKNICCVGDDDQSIYGWRGAEVGNILRFEQDFPGARIVRLERNYRSTPHILAAAAQLIANNSGRLGKTLWTSLNEGEKVAVRGFWDGDEEARAVADEIQALAQTGERLDAAAILVRAGFQTRAFEERFIALGLKYRVIGGLRFYEREEIRDAIAYLRVVAQPDDDLAFERVVNWPRRGLGDATMRVLHQVARTGAISLVAAARILVDTHELTRKAQTAVRALLGQFERWRSLIDNMSPAELAEMVLDESGYNAMWQADRSIEAPGRLENLKELMQALTEFESLAAFLEHVSLVMENDRGTADDMINLMTLHGAKGLEFDTVFLPGWEEGLFPNQRTLDEGAAAGLEEERRLAYVGLTRARRRCQVSFAANRRIFGQWQAAMPSRFIDELPAAHVTRNAQPGVYGAVGLADSGLGTFEYAAPWLGSERRAAMTRRDQTAPGRARANDAKAIGGLRVGARVFHQKFGYGRVTQIDDGKLTVAFDKAGEKRVIASYVALA